MLLKLLNKDNKYKPFLFMGRWIIYHHMRSLIVVRLVGSFFWTGKIKSPLLQGLARKMDAALKLAEILFDVKIFTNGSQDCLCCYPKLVPVNRFGYGVIIHFTDLVEIDKVAGCLNEPVNRLRVNDWLEAGPRGDARSLCEPKGFNPFGRRCGARLPLDGNSRIVMGESNGKQIPRIPGKNIKITGSPHASFGEDLGGDVILPENFKYFPSEFRFDVHRLIRVAGETEQHRRVRSYLFGFLLDPFQHVRPDRWGAVKFCPVREGCRWCITIGA